MERKMLPTTNKKEYLPSKHTDSSSLPLDVILAITDHLPASCVACLSLTCKSLYYSQPIRNVWTKGLDPLTFPSKCPHTDYPCYPGIENRNHDYFDLVRMLREDLPTHLLCDYCQKFHPKPLPKVSRPENEWISCPGAPEKGMHLSWPKFGVHLQFEDVQMVMNRHRWGGAHGAPLSSISIATDWKVIRNVQNSPSVCKFELEPEIVEGNLLIHTMQHIFFTARQLDGRSQAIEPERDGAAAFKVCKHNTSIIYWDIYRLTMSSPVQMLERGKGCGKTRLLWCKVCNTCFCLEAAYHGDGHWTDEPGGEGFDMPAEGLEVTLHTWVSLGTCEHTFSSSWLHVCEQRADAPMYPAQSMAKAKEMALKTVEKTTLPRIRTQDCLISSRSCSKAIQHLSLLAAIDQAVALENDAFAAKHHEITKILRKAKHKVDERYMPFIVENALAVTPVKYDLEAPSSPANLRNAMKILREHKRAAAKVRPLHERLGFSISAKLSRVFSLSHREYT